MAFTEWSATRPRAATGGRAGRVGVRGNLLRAFLGGFDVSEATGALRITHLAGAMLSLDFSCDPLRDRGVTACLNFLQQHALGESEAVTDRNRIKRLLETDAHAQISFLKHLTVGMEINCTAISGAAEHEACFVYELQKIWPDHVLQGNREHWPARLAATRTT